MWATTWGFKSPLRRHLTASPSSLSPPPAGRPKRTTVSLPEGARVGTDVGPTRCAPSVRPLLLRPGPSPRASSGPSPRRRQAPPERTRGRSPLPSRPRRTASSPGASRHSGCRNRRSRFAARDVSPDQEGRSGFAAKYGVEPRRDAFRSAASSATGRWRRNRPRGRSKASAFPPPAPRGAARPGVPFRHGTVPCGW